MKASIALAAVVAVALVGCTPSAPPTTTSTARPMPSVTPSAEPLPIVPVQPTGEVADVVTGLSAPWSIARLESGSALISERPHRGALGPKDARQILLGAAGTQLDAELVRLFCSLL